MKGVTKKQEAVKENSYEVKVTRATQFDDSSAGFDITVNGITIYGMIYREYVNSKKEEGFLIDFPSRKGKDGKYYHHVFFPITLELKNDIHNQLIHMLNEV